MSTPWDSPMIPPLTSRRRSRGRARFALVEPLEPRLVLDAGAASLVQAPPSTFGSAAEFRQYLIDAAVAEWKSVLGTTVSAPPWTVYGPVPVDFAMIAGSAPAASSDHSGTNNQVQGVDEGDVVETDGKFLYILAGQDLKIVDARDPGSLSVAASVAIDGRPIAEYLDGTRLTIISSLGGGYWYPGVMFPASLIGSGSGSGPQVKVTELDVSDPTAPAVVRQTTMDGSYVNSRAVGDRVYVVLQDSLPYLPSPQAQREGDQYVYEAEDAYRARLATVLAGVSLPRFTSQAAGQPDANGDEVGYDAIYKPTSPGDQSLFTVMTFDAASAAAGPSGSVGVVASGAATVYASPDHLYLLSPEGGYYGGYAFVPAPTQGTTTVIHMFDLGGDDVTLEATGSVPGTVLDQFSVDEQGAYLRIATTETTTTAGLPFFAYDSSNSSSNSVYVLSAQDGALTVVGSLTGIAPGERIYAARFFGDRAYLDTFRQFDPLFALDLSDPTAPKLTGSLEIPGFSRYLQPIDATHVIGIGQDIANNEPSGVQVSLFDVSDPANPRRVALTTISTGPSYWMTTSQQYDPHQLFYDPATQTLAIPINGYYTTDSVTGVGSYHSSLWVFKVDLGGGSLTQLGQVEADANDTVERAVRIGDVLFSISQDAVQAFPIGDPSTILGRVQIADPNPDPIGDPWPIVIDPIVPITVTPLDIDPGGPIAPTSLDIDPGGPVSPQPAPADPGPATNPSPATVVPAVTSNADVILAEANLFKARVIARSQGHPGTLSSTAKAGPHSHPGGPLPFHVARLAGRSTNVHHLALSALSSHHRPSGGRVR
jgi:uncharacterized secreted protein with C-terminal beta-propeller domain